MKGRAPNTPMTKRTLGGTSRKRKRVSGFRVRMRSHTGRRVIRTRRKRGRSHVSLPDRSRTISFDGPAGIHASAGPSLF